MAPCAPRSERRLTREELARLAGVDPRSVALAERSADPATLASIMAAIESRGTATQRVDAVPSGAMAPSRDSAENPGSGRAHPVMVGLAAVLGILALMGALGTASLLRAGGPRPAVAPPASSKQAAGAGAALSDDDICREFSDALDSALRPGSSTSLRADILKQIEFVHPMGGSVDHADSWTMKNRYISAFRARGVSADARGRIEGPMVFGFSIEVATPGGVRTFDVKGHALLRTEGQGADRLLVSWGPDFPMETTKKGETTATGSDGEDAAPDPSFPRNTRLNRSSPPEGEAPEMQDAMRESVRLHQEGLRKRSPDETVPVSPSAIR